MRAALLFRHRRHYRSAEFAHGLECHGYTISTAPERAPKPTDLLVIWNRTRAHEHYAAMYERAGAKVIVAENGWLNRQGGTKHYALALNHHNGAGRWFVGDRPRFEIEEEHCPRGDAVLILPQRGIGERGVAMPLDWPRTIRDRVRQVTGRPVIYRRHPGNNHSALQATLEQDLSRAHCVVTWASGAAIKAIRAGVPCFHEMADWIGNCASTRLADQLERCDSPDPGELWRRVSWGQWTMAEIESGEAFDRLLHADDCSLFCARQPSLPRDCAGHGRGDHAVR